MDLIFLDNYEENYICHDKFKKYFLFVEKIDLFCDLNVPCTTTSNLAGSKKIKIPLKTDIIQNDIIVGNQTAKWVTLFTTYDT